MLAFFPLVPPVVPKAMTGAFVQEANKTTVLGYSATSSPGNEYTYSAFCKRFWKPSG